MSVALHAATPRDDAVRAAEEGAHLGLQASDAHTYLLAQYFEAWALLHAGRWGEMRRILDHGLEMAQRNQHTRWAVLFLLELSWLHEQCFDFEVALQMSKQGYEQAREIEHPYTELLGMILLALAHMGLEQYDAAFRWLREAGDRLARERILMDWVLGILLHYALSRYWLAQGNPAEARKEAERVCELAGAPGERNYLALAHLVIAETAMGSGDWGAADASVAQSLALLEGVDAPLAEWRVRAVAADLQKQKGRVEEATQHQRRRVEILNRLADSLHKGDRLRDSLLGATVVQSSLPGS